MYLSANILALAGASGTVISLSARFLQMRHFQNMENYGIFLVKIRISIVAYNLPDSSSKIKIHDNTSKSKQQLARQQ